MGVIGKFVIALYYFVGTVILAMNDASARTFIVFVLIGILLRCVIGIFNIINGGPLVKVITQDEYDKMTNGETPDEEDIKAENGDKFITLTSVDRSDEKPFLAFLSYVNSRNIVVKGDDIYIVSSKDRDDVMAILPGAAENMASKNKEIFEQFRDESYEGILWVEEDNEDAKNDAGEDN